MGDDRDPVGSPADDVVDEILRTAFEAASRAPDTAYDSLIEATGALSCEPVISQAEYAGGAYLALAGLTDIIGWSRDERRFARAVEAAARSWLSAADRPARRRWVQEWSTVQRL